MTVRILLGDVRARLGELPSESVHTVVTSPPYFRQRDYGMPGQIGQESTPADFAEALSSVFKDVHRVLRSDGSLWLQIGDAYAAGGNGGGGKLVAKRRGEPWFRSTVWTIRPQPTHTGHPAVMPAELARRCVVCSTKRGDTVLDPFGGSGTTAMVADGLQRDAILIELNPEYAEIARRRIEGDGTLIATTEVAA